MESIPKEFICPITQEVMKDPVIGPDGMTYEKEAIVNWLKKHKASPITRQPMDPSQLVPNRALKSTIEEMVSGKLHVENLPLADQPTLIALDLQLATARGKDGKGYLQMAVTPPEDGPRQPSVFICALDISGSMNEEASIDAGVEAAHFSRLDLVKHSVKTISHMLSDNDYLAIIAFNDAATTVLQLTRMNELGKKIAQDSIEALEADGQTNIWDALRSSISMVGANPACRYMNTCILLFTDGEPNVNPPRGIMRSLNNLMKSVSRVFSIHTFGYGYQLDSELLLDIATAGFGAYNYIPDSTMVGTIFVNFVSNALSSAVKNVYIVLKSENVENVAGVGFDTDPARIQVCSVQYGQRRDLVLEFKPKSSEDFCFEAQLFYGKKSVTKRIAGFECADQKNFHLALSRALFCSVIINALAQQISSKQGLKELSKAKKLLEELPTKSDEYVKELLRDITSKVESEGQITKAFSKDDWFDKWGKHYVRSLIRAHQMQQCHNFKDRGVQNYGGKYFRDLQDKTEELFGTLPAPKPSPKVVRQGKPVYKAAPPVDYAPVNMYNYIDMNIGCFDGDGILLLSNGQYKRVRELVKGDAIVNSDGRVAKVVALVVTRTRHVVEFVRLNDVLITPWHPVRIAGEWKFPQSVQASEQRYCNEVFNLVLDQEHVATINGLDVVTLGHGLRGSKVVEHVYFGTQRVVDDLRNFAGWENGRVDIHKWKPTRDAETGLVNGLAL